MRKTLTLLGLTVLALLGVGFVLLASAGEETGRNLHHSATYFVTHQAMWLCVAIVFMFLAARFDYHNWRRYPYLTVCLYLVIAGLMFAVLFAPETKGSHRWLRLVGSVRLQPSELGKIFVVIAAAVFLDGAGWRIEKFWKGAAPAALIIGVLIVLALAEPDFGTTLIITLTGLALCLVGGMRISHFAAMGALAAVGIAVGGHKVGHHVDGLAAVAGALQGEVDEVAVVNALGVALAEGCDSAPGGLAHGELVLVDETYYAVGERGLSDVDLVLEAALVVQAEHFACGMGAAGVEAQLSVAGVAVGGVGDHGAAVGSGPPAEEEIGACATCRGCGGSERKQQKCNK